MRHSLGYFESSLNLIKEYLSIKANHKKLMLAKSIAVCFFVTASLGISSILIVLGMAVLLPESDLLPVVTFFILCASFFYSYKLKIKYFNVMSGLSVIVFQGLIVISFFVYQTYTLAAFGLPIVFSFFATLTLIETYNKQLEFHFGRVIRCLRQND